MTSQRLTVASCREVALAEDILDAIDSSMVGELHGEMPYVGPIATIRSLSQSVSASESVVRRAVFRLHDCGLVKIVDGLDPAIGRRRLFVIGEEV